MSKPPIFIHVDLDGLWTLPACYGYPEREDFTRDPVFEIGVDRLLALFAEFGVQATFFIVGRDLELPAKVEAVRRIVAAGHALANHSYTHDLALESRSEGVIAGEIVRTNEAIQRATGAQAIGFRAPGYGSGPKTLEACARSSIKYDGSLFLSAYGGLLRFGMRRLQRRVRVEFGNQGQAAAELGTTFGAAEKPSGTKNFTPRLVQTATGELWRFPVAISPFLLLPLQASLAIHFGAARVARALKEFGESSGPATWLLHGMDVLGSEDLVGRLPRALADSKAFKMSYNQKREFLADVLKHLAVRHKFELTEEWMRHE